MAVRPYPCPFCFEGHLHAETRIEIRAIIEIDGNFGTIASFFKQCERPHDFSGEILAFNHGDVLPAQCSYIGAEVRRGAICTIAREAAL